MRPPSCHLGVLASESSPGHLAEVFFSPYQQLSPCGDERQRKRLIFLGGEAIIENEKYIQMNAAIYARVSTTDQTNAIQIRELKDYVERRGWTLAGVYQDQMSGAKVSRPGLDQLMADARLRRFDAVVVWKLDRFGRSLVHCVSGIQELASMGIRFLATSQGLDTDESNPASKLLLHILAAVAQFERELIHERVSAGIESCKEARHEDWKRNWATAADLRPGRSGAASQNRTLNRESSQSDGYWSRNCSPGDPGCWRCPGLALGQHSSSYSDTFQLRPRSVILIANAGSAGPSTIGSVLNRSIEILTHCAGWRE
jgi:putative DNA-invertase from lambdoid prophage Rac